MVSCPTCTDEAPPRPEYAFLWKRLAAFLIDLPLLLLLGGISRLVFSQIVGIEYVAGWIYFAAMESSGLQATFGKKVLGLRVTSLQGNRLGFWRASGRYWGKFISVISLGAGFAMAIFTREKQAFHDYVAGSVVLDDRAPRKELSPGSSAEPS